MPDIEPTGAPQSGESSTNYDQLLQGAQPEAAPSAEVPAAAPEAEAPKFDYDAWLASGVDTAPAGQAEMTQEQKDEAAFLEETRRLVTQRRGTSPTPDQLYYINAARKEGKWL